MHSDKEGCWSFPKSFFQAAQILYGQRLSKRKCNPGFHCFTCKRSDKSIHSLIDQTVPKENTWRWQTENLAHKSLSSCPGGPSTILEKIHVLLITLAKIDPGSLITSLSTTVRCRAMKFSGNRLPNKDRALSVSWTCQAWPNATVWYMTPIFWHFSSLEPFVIFFSFLFFNRGDY